MNNVNCFLHALHRPFCWPIRLSLSLRGIRTLPRPFPFCEYPKIAIDGSPGGYVFGDSNGDSNGVLHFSGTKYNFLKIVLKNLGFARTVISTV